MTATDVALAVFAHNPVPSIVIDLSGRVVEVNDAYLAMTRRTRDAVIGMFSVDFIHADDLMGALAGLDALEAGDRVVRQRRRHRRGDGSWILVEALSSRVPVGDERLLLVQSTELGEVTDIESDAEARSRLTILPFGDAACFHDADGRFTFLTSNLADVLGRPTEWLYGRRITDPELHPVHTDGTPYDPGDDPAVEAIATGATVSRTVGLRSASGTVEWFSVRAGPVESPTIRARTALRDIGDLVRAQEEARRLAAIVERELTHRADHDSLTGLKARHVVAVTLEALHEAGQPSSVVFVDLDGFKAVNDELGHLVGDEVLVAVGRRLQELLPDGAVLGRNGGDEFVAVFTDRADADGFADGVAAGPLTGSPLPPLRGSVGVAHGDPGDSPRRLLHLADEAMYAAKRAGQTGTSRRAV